MFTDTGFWDTFRALFPFYNLMERKLNTNIQRGLVNAVKEGGWLPEWASPGYRNVMIGSNSASVIADAYLKGLHGCDIDTLYAAAKKGSHHEGPLEAVGRAGADYYNKMGYVPYDIDLNESAARTLEYAYDDFTLYKLAKALDRPQDEIDPELAWLFENCFPNTLDTMVEFAMNDGAPDTFVITGDIEAMWLRDSSSQVRPYVALASGGMGVRY